MNVANSMIGRIIMMLLQFLDDTFRNVRCYSKCCQVNERSCTNTNVSREDEVKHHHRQTTEDSKITTRSQHSSIEHDESEHVP